MNGDRGPTREDDEALVSEDIEATLVYDAYRASVEAGHPADPEKLLAEHPALADRLKTLIAASELVASIAGDVFPNLVDYRIIRELGRGGMGIVYEAEQISRARHVAIKVLTATAAMDPQQLKRFLHVEVPAAKLLRHRHIVPMVDFGCEHGVYYYAMQFIDGQNLAQLIKAPARSESVETTEVDPALGVGVAHGNGIIPSTQLPEPTRRWSLADASDRFGETARWGLQAAEALDFAHQQGVVHRDIKPSNLLLDGWSNVWITDFGLAHIQGEAHFTATGDLTGTPRYMSPEQVRARGVVVDHRTDIYSLGVTLYELLTLRPAIDGDSPQDVLRRVIEEEPAAPRRVDPDIPRDLETIVLKAMSKERDDRYQTARELADDLRRFLDHTPIQAQRPSPLDRASRWARKHHKAVATVIALLLTAVAGLSVVVIWIARAENRAVGAELLAVSAKARAVAAEAEAKDRARESQFESLMQKILRLRLTSHYMGWSRDAWGLVSEAAKLHPHDRGAFQAQAAATLMDLDAYAVTDVPAPASSLSFDPTGKRLWMGGLGQELSTLDHADNRTKTHGPAIDGAIAVRADGTALQLGMVRDKKTGASSLQLWDTGKQTARIINLPDPSAAIVACAISPQGTYGGAVVEPVQGKRHIVIWEMTTGRFLPEIEFPAADLTFSPDASLIAAWDSTGKIGIWTLPETAPVAFLQSGDTPIRSIAFGRARGLAPHKTAAKRWLLAAGDAGGVVAIWDLEKLVPVNSCRGSLYDIHAVAFGPDGTTLVSAGRSNPKVWDVATGRVLLDLRHRNTMTSVAFSPDGTRLAIGSQTAHGSAGRVDAYQLENGRGIRNLRGLRGPVPKAIFSRDGRLVAGLSQDWQVAIWDRFSAELRITLDVPQGQFADNSGLAFSPDSRRFAFSAGHQAKLWDIETRTELGAWTFPEGLVDSIAYPEANQLFLLRVETQDEKAAPDSRYPPETYPRVLRLRMLLGHRPTEPVRAIADFNWHVHHAAATPDGKYFVADGLYGPKGTTRSVNAYDAATGVKLWSMPSRKNRGAGAGFLFDPTGRVLSLDVNTDGPTAVLNMATRAALGSIDEHPQSLGPEGKIWLSLTQSNMDRTFTCVIHEREQARSVLQIATHSSTGSVLISFSPDGRSVVWGNSDGSVSICDLDEVKSWLSKVGLGW
jgi:serine/threonine protein kinase/WD40 repeat protein